MGKETKVLSDAEFQKLLVSTCAGLGGVKLVIQFDGSGDDGQIDGISLYDAGGNPIEIPAKIQLPYTASRGQTYDGKNWVDIIEHKEGTLEEAVKAWAYRKLGSNEFGYDWVNNEGGFGEIIITLTNPYSFVISYEQRIEETEHHDFVIRDDGSVVEGEADEEQEAA